MLGTLGSERGKCKIVDIGKEVTIGFTIIVIVMVIIIVIIVIIVVKL